MESSEQAAANLKISCPLRLPDADLFVSIWNQGIDSWLTAFVESEYKVENGRIFFEFDAGEVEILLRRLEAEETEEADQWVDNVLEFHYGVDSI